MDDKIQQIVNSKVEGRLHALSFPWQISLRVDQPVEGMTVTAHAICTPNDKNDYEALMHNADNKPKILFRWFRSKEWRGCANALCMTRTCAAEFSSKITSQGPAGPDVDEHYHNQNSVHFMSENGYSRYWGKYSGDGDGGCGRVLIQSVVGEREDLTPQMSLFCSAECVKEGWKQHLVNVREHRRAPPRPPDVTKITGDGMRDALRNLPPPSKPPRILPIMHEGDGKWTSKQHDDLITQDITWEEVTLDAVGNFRASPQDVGRCYRVECSATNVRTGEVCAQPQHCHTSLVLPRPPPLPPPVIVQRLALPDIIENGANMRVITYNVLAEIYATKQMYPYCPAWALVWEYRSRLVMRTLVDSRADIICLQEVQADHYESTFLPALKAEGFAGVYKQKTREAMGQEGKVDGCATFYRTSKFTLHDQRVVEFDSLVHVMLNEEDSLFSKMSSAPSAQQLASRQRRKEKVARRLCKNNVAQIIVLHNTKGEPFCLTNTHLYSKPECPDVKLWQAYKLLVEVERVTTLGQLNSKMPLLLCGDFNSEPSSSVYQLLSKGYVDPQHKDLLADQLQILRLHSNTIKHSLSLVSCVSAVVGEEPPFTNHTGHWSGVVDYIWCTKRRFMPYRAVQVPSMESQEYQPNIGHPSDHVPLASDLVFTQK